MDAPRADIGPPPEGLVRPGRLLLLTETDAASWASAWGLARVLAAWGTGVHLATVGRPLTPAQREASGAVAGLTVHPGPFGAEGAGRGGDEGARAGDWLLGLEARLAPDVVHLQGLVHGALPWRRAPLLAVPRCPLTRWEALEGDAPLPERLARYGRAARRGLAGAGRVVAPTGALLEALARHHGPLPPASVVPEARLPADFPPADKEPFVLTVGSALDAAAGLAALGQVAPHLPWAVCVAGGDGTAAGAPGAPPSLKGLGRLPPRALAQWMGRAAVFALPVRDSGFGVTALEAALAGCALVLGDVPALREVWGDAALYAEADEPSALLAALQRLVVAPATRRRLATHARTRALSYGPARQAEGYLRAYAALGGPAAAAAPRQGAGTG
jgi:glycosyltransferase involved in cell wall biosynthesis